MSTKKKWNLMDTVIVIFLAAVIGAGAFLIHRLNTPTEEKTKTIVLEVTEKKQGFAEVLKPGDQIWESTKKQEFGVLKQVEVKPARKDVKSAEDGSIRCVEIPERYDLYLTIEIPESEKANVGQGLWLESQRYKCNGYILEVSEEAAE